MNAENTEKLFKEFPEFFKYADNLQASLMSFGFEYGDGWFDLTYQLFKDLKVEYEKMGAALKDRFYIIQAKEKWGTLRIYTSFGSTRIFDLIDDAGIASGLICEVCGKEGKTRPGVWVSTLCDQHAKERGYITEDKAGL